MRTGFSDAVGILYLVNEEIAVAVPSAGVSIGAFAQVDTLSPITPPPQPVCPGYGADNLFACLSNNLYRSSLIVAGLVVQERDRGFRHLRNDYVPSFRLHYDDYLQYAPAALMLGLKIGGVRGAVRGAGCWCRMPFPSR